MLGSLPESFVSKATIRNDRRMVLVLVVENVTDRKAAWYWAGVAEPVSVSTPAEFLAIVMPSTGV